MGNHITDTFARMDLGQIRQFLLYGTEAPEISGELYDTQLIKASEAIYRRIEGVYSEQNDRDAAADEIANALAVRGDVYMEIGIKAGARLIYQLLIADNPIPPRKCTDEIKTATDRRNGGIA